MHRFYIPPETPDTPEIVVSGPEAHHALHVARLRAGDAVQLFDGRGREVDGAVASTTRDLMTVAVEELRRLPPPSKCLTLAQAWLHQDKALEFVVQHGTALGIKRIVFFRADHSERAPRPNGKWLRIAIESCKQCGRAWLPSFETAPGLEALLKTVSGSVLIATKALQPIPLRHAAKGGDLTLVVGPEGDFSDMEIRLAQHHGVIPIALGAATYRSEVASVLGAALLLYELGELGPARA